MNQHSETFISESLALVRRQIQAAESAAGRPAGSVRLLAVSKTKPASDIRAAFLAGQREFGENYQVEALSKITELVDLPLIWHYIGAIQSNKTRSIAEHFDWVHSIDRLKIAERLSAQRPDNRGPLNCCVQLNLDDETSKHGVTVEALPELCRQASRLPGIRLRGIMVIPAPRSEHAAQRAAFATVRRLFEQVREELPALDTLSMGMSADMEAAIAEGATIVRIGTAIFGARDAKPATD